MLTKFAVVAQADGKLVLVGDDFDINDYTTVGDVHIVPCTVQGQDYHFGVHEFTRNCCCHPKVEGDPINRVIHRTEVN